MQKLPLTAEWCAVNESLIKEAADRLVSLGLADLGYKYFAVDGIVKDDSIA